MKKMLVSFTLLIALGLIAAPAFGAATVKIVCTGSTVCSAAGEPLPPKKGHHDSFRGCLLELILFQVECGK